MSASSWPFAAVGLVVPGLSQVVFILAVRHAGPSRAAILIGTAPLGSVLLAIALARRAAPTGSPRRHGARRRRRRRPRARPGSPGRLPHARRRARARRAPRSSLRATTPCAGSRATTTSPRSQASAATLLGRDARHGSSTSLVDEARALADARPTRRAGLPPGRVLLALAYGALVTGFDRGRRRRSSRRSTRRSRSGASPSRRSSTGGREAIGRRTVLAGVLVVLGGALIGAFR